MAGSVNKVILVGNLGADPQIRRLANGNPVANLRVATSESWRDRETGERRDRTEWHSVIIFNENLAKLAGEYLRKGAKIYVEGALQTRKWQDGHTGTDRYTTEIVLQRYQGVLQMLDTRSDEDGQSRSSSVGSYAEQSGAGRRRGRSVDTTDDDHDDDFARRDLDHEIPF